MIYVLFILLIGGLIISYLFTKDIFSPPCMICESYVLAAFCAILNIEKWGIDLKGKTVFFILYGVLLFVLSYFIFAAISKIKQDKMYRITTKKENISSTGEKSISYIDYNKIVCFFLVVIQFVFVLSYLYFFAKSMGGFSFSNFSDLMTEYRLETSFEDTLKIPTILKQLHKFFKGFIFLLTYIEIHNFLVAKLKKEKKKLSNIFIISLLLFIGQAILSSGRAELVIYFIFALITYYTIYINYFGLKSFNMKKIIKVTCIVLVALYGFSAIKTVFGRVSDDGVIDYVSKYFGGSIELLDLYLENPPPKSYIWGKETFYNIHQVLGKIGIGETYVVHLEFRSNNGVNIGNVYTALRRMYQDFGMFGLTILQVIFAFAMHLYYKKVRKYQKLNQINIGIVFWGIMAHAMLLNSFSEYFYSSIISMNYLLIIIYMIIIKFLITRKIKC